MTQQYNKCFKYFPVLCEFKGIVCFQDNSGNLNISPLNSKMNAMATLHQLVVSVNHEGPHRPWGAVTEHALNALPRKY